MKVICVAVVMLGLSTLSQCYYKPAPCLQVASASATGLSDDVQSEVDAFRSQWFDTDNFPSANLTPLQTEWLASLGDRPPDYNSSLSKPKDVDAQARKKCGASCYCIPNALQRNPPNGVRRRVRREIRQMTSFERNAFIAAVNDLRNFIPDSNDPTTSAYDIFVLIHRQSESPAAQWGPSFLPWHREYLYRFENALISRGYIYGLPYWDSSLDQTLPHPSDANLWTTDLLGIATGEVGEPFPNWDIIQGTCSDTGTTLTRRIRAGSLGKNMLYSDEHIGGYMSLPCFRDLALTSSFQDVYGAVHLYVGGHMRRVQCAPSDPVFFIHLAFVDCLWEEFRQNSQTSPLEREYPPQENGDFTEGVELDWDKDTRLPRGLKNAHGILNWYTDFIYKYSPRPVRCSTDFDCGNLHQLWCDVSNCRCRPKVKKGGNCKGLPDRACACKISEGFPMCKSNVCECEPLPVAVEDVNI